MTKEQELWWKELGNRIGDGSLEKDYPKAHVKIRVQYYKKMSEVTGVNFQGKDTTPNEMREEDRRTRKLDEIAVVKGRMKTDVIKSC